MQTAFLDPVDVCGCGDEGYLTTQTLPVDLRHGVGKIHHVPVYHCRSKLCPEYTLPAPVSHRLERMAEQMEETLSLETEFIWSDLKSKENALPTSNKNNEPNFLVQSFTLKFVNREYEDAQVVFVSPGQAIFLQSHLDRSEYHLLRYEPEAPNKGVRFSFSKFYSDEPILDYEQYLLAEPGNYLKELAVLTLEEVEDSLIDEFGESI
ncbi:MAG: hypothetical protein ACYCVD_09880 [Desulfitobacteriaceae bacterium]